MPQESYTPGHTQNATDFMVRRSLESHGQFFLPYLMPGLTVLDCGCGPGSITLGIASRIMPSKVIGVDFAASQIARAQANALQAVVPNVEFQTADCYALPFDKETFDCVFCHALLEHVADPVRVLKEFHRVLKPGGIVGVCSPDWNGLLIAPPSSRLSEATEIYAALQTRNGGDLRVGAKFSIYLAAAGFQKIQLSARYECYPSLNFIGEYLALQLEREGELAAADTIRAWSHTEGGLFAQAWVAAIAQTPQP